LFIVVILERRFCFEREGKFGLFDITFRNSNCKALIHVKIGFFSLWEFWDIHVKNKGKLI